MPYVVKLINRNWAVINTLDFMVEWDSIARVIVCFVDCIELKEIGFEKTEPCFEGGSCYDLIKRAMGAVCFLLKGKQKAGGEFALMAMGDTTCPGHITCSHLRN